MQRNEVLTLLALPVQKVLTLKALLVQRNGQNNEVLRLLALLVHKCTNTDAEGAARAAKRAK
jgi:hypothetical protein